MDTGWIIYTAVLFLVLIITLIVAFIKNKKAKGEEKKVKKFKEIFLDKLELLSLILFIFAMFLLDVNANQLAAYGIDKTVTIFQDITASSTSLFWLGFLIGLVSYLTFCITSIVHRKGALKKLDLFFGVIGGIGLGIILSGGLLIFVKMDDMIIPFFSWTLTRTSYYHIGIAIEAVTVLYFALTK